MTDKYLKNCEKVYVHQKIEGGYIVQKYIDIHYEYETKEDLSGEKIFVEDVFDKPPTDVKDKSIDELCERIQSKSNLIKALSDEENNLQISISKRQTEIEEMESEAKKYSALKNAIDYINGEFTHFAIIPSYSKPYITTKNEGLDDEGTYSRDTKLLTLFGKSNGNLAWKLNQYNDGSGSWSQVSQPCKSEEEAVDFIVKIIIKEMLEFVNNDGIKSFNSYKYDWAIENNLALPKGFKEKNNKIEKKQWQSNVESMENQIKERTITLAKYKEKLKGFVEK